MAVCVVTQKTVMISWEGSLKRCGSKHKSPKLVNCLTHHIIHALASLNIGIGLSVTSTTLNQSTFMHCTMVAVNWHYRLCVHAHSLVHIHRVWWWRHYWCHPPPSSWRHHCSAACSSLVSEEPAVSYPAKCTLKREEKIQQIKRWDFFAPQLCCLVLDGSGDY